MGRAEIEHVRARGEHQLSLQLSDRLLIPGELANIEPYIGYLIESSRTDVRILHLVTAEGGGRGGLGGRLDYIKSRSP